MITTDALIGMFLELRAQLPPLPSPTSDADARLNWISGMRQIIQAMPTPEQRRDCTMLLADDMVTLRYPDMPLSMAYGWLAKEFGVEDLIGPQE